MTKQQEEHLILLRRIRIVLAGFVAGLILSGLTAFPLRFELDLLARWLGASDASGVSPDGSALLNWIVTVRDAVRATDVRYPFLAYGTDWLAFAHLVIAIAFIGPWRNPVRNIWVIEWGLIASVLVVPLALICGPLRGIPLGWRLVDCSFCLLGCAPLWLCRRWTLQLEQLQKAS